MREFYHLYPKETEQAIICGLVTQEVCFTKVAGVLDPDHFSFDAYKSVFDVMAYLFANHCPIDVVSVGDELVTRGIEDGRMKIMELAKSGAGTMMCISDDYALKYHCNKLIDFAKRRETFKIAEEIQDHALDMDNRRFTENAQALLMMLDNAYKTDMRKQNGELVNDVMDRIKLKMTTNAITGLSSGIKALDRATDGFLPYQLITVAARPGGGKSAFAMNVAQHIAFDLNRPVLYLSLEMNAEELLARLIKSISGTSTDIRKMQEAADKIKQYQHNLIIDDTAGQTLSYIQSAILKAKQANPDLAMVFIDHLGLIDAEKKTSNQNRTYELGNITKALKTMTRSLQIPIMQLCQMNRGIEGRQVKQPMLSDLKDSDSIAADSDTVFFMKIERSEDGNPTGEAAINIAKQRDGVVADIPLLFVPSQTRFKDKHSYSF